MPVTVRRFMRRVGGGGGGGGGGPLTVAIGLASVVPGNLVSGKSGTISVTVQNTGNVATTSSSTTVTATLPTGLTYASAAGTGWSCAASGGANVSCSTSALIAANSDASLLTLTIVIGASASGPGVITFAVTNPQGTNAMSQLPMAFNILYTVGGSVQGLNANGLALSDNGGDQLGVGANGPFTFAAALPNGATYAVAVATQPAGQSCQLQNATGTIIGGNVTGIGVSCVTPSGHYAFVGNKFSSTVSVYLIGVDGALAQITGSPFAAKGVFSMAINPAGTLLYATNYGPDTVTGLGVASGVLTPVAQAPVAVGTNPTSVAIDPGGKFLYVGNLNSNNVSAFTVNSATGALTAVSGSPFGLPGAGVWIGIAPVANHLYVTGTGVSGFSLDPGTGVLTPIAGSPFFDPVGGNPTGIGIDPAGKYAYVANNITDNISVFAINSATGALTVSTPYATGTGTGPYDAVIDPAGTCLYVSLRTAGTVFAFAIGGLGSLGSVNLGVPAGSSPQQIAMDPTGKFV